jgi:hypothetical protein
MRRLPVLAIWLVALSMFVISHTASADMEDCDSREIAATKAGLEESKRFEAKGDYETAYKRIRDFGSCDINDKVLANELATAEKRLGPKAASQMEDKNPKEACELYLRYNSNNQKLLKDADRAILKYAQSAPFDKPGGFLACTPSDDAKVRAELSALAARNADKVLEKEAALFNEKLSRDEMIASKVLLETAYSWGRINLINNEPASAKVKEVAIKRGDTLKAHGDAKSLGYAIEYYDLFGSNGHKNDDKIKSVKIKASGLGDDMMKNKDYKLAAEYFDVAREHEKKKEALRLAKENKDEKEKSTKEEEKGAKVKEAKRKKDFKKDTDAFEKELGL